MKKVFLYGFGIVFSVIVYFVLLSAAIESVVYNMTFYKWHYQAHQIDQDTEMELDELMAVTEKMVDYLQDQRESLDMEAIIAGKNQEVFGDREKSHMVDVKNMSVAMHRFEVIGGLFSLIILAFIFLSKKKEWLSVLKPVKFVFAFLTIAIALLGYLLVTDFDKYFTLFHETFFDNDLWLLDPDTDILINMVPEIFFYTTVILVLAFFVSYLTVFILGTYLIKKKMLKKLG